MAEKTLQQDSDESFEEDESDIREIIKELSREDLEEEYISLEKRNFYNGMMKDIFWGGAVIELFYFNPDWNGEEFTEEEGEKIGRRIWEEMTKPSRDKKE